MAHSTATTSDQLACDVLVIGGGINGVGVARDAAGRGLSVVLCEKDDLASHTSSASTKLIHGGLRYLEYGEFALVRKSLIEREILMRSAPHLIWPLQFVMPHSPHDKNQRPAWMIRAGLFLYDHLARRDLLPASSTINLRTHIAGAPLKANFNRAFVYSDGWVDDARLVVANAIDAAEKGARIFTRTRCESAQRNGDHWLACLRTASGQKTDLRARVMVNAAGPWAGDFLQSVAKVHGNQALRLIKGSHIIVRKLFAHPYAYLLQHPDKRIVFAIPYENDFTLIGTTDLDFHGSLDDVAIEPSETNYLCDLASHYFAQKIVPEDVIRSYAGVRPLLDEGTAAHGSASSVTRDYRFDLNQDGAPLLSIFGGKITTFRRLAEEALAMLRPLLPPHGTAWTAHACLPGGALLSDSPSNRSVTEFAQYVRQKQRDYAWLDPLLVARYVRAYGNRIDRLLAGCSNLESLGDEIVPTLFATEVRYLVEHEWAVSASDILWRRSKLGLHLLPDAEEVLALWMQQDAEVMSHWVKTNR